MSFISIAYCYYNHSHGASPRLSRSRCALLVPTSSYNE